MSQSPFAAPVVTEDDRLRHYARESFVANALQHGLDDDRTRAAFDSYIAAVKS